MLLVDTGLVTHKRKALLDVFTKIKNDSRNEGGNEGRKGGKNKKEREKERMEGEIKEEKEIYSVSSIIRKKELQGKMEYIATRVKVKNRLITKRRKQGEMEKFVRRRERGKENHTGVKLRSKEAERTSTEKRGKQERGITG